MPNPIKTAYIGRSAHKYDARRFSSVQGQAFHKMELEQLLRGTGGLDKGSRVLDVGCGTGRFLEELLGRGYRLTGVDPSADMLAETARKLGDADLRLIQAEGAALPFEAGQFDLVYAIRVLNQTESESYAWRVVDEMIRVTAPGGSIVIEFANRWRPSAGNRSVRLSLGAMALHTSARGDVEVVSQSGLAVLSQSVFEQTPKPLLGGWSGLERQLGRRFPQLGSRCYVILRKTQ